MNRFYIYGIYKNGTDEPIGRAGIDIDVEKTLVNTEEEEEGGMNRESSTDIYTPSCIK